LVYGIVPVIILSLLLMSSVVLEGVSTACRRMCVVQICGYDYSKDLLQWIEPDNLPEWLGGRSKGTLLDDCGPWSDPEVLRRLEGSAVAAKALKRLSSSNPAVSSSEAQLVVVDNELAADGYHSPRWAWHGGVGAACGAVW
jgi:hypothetical protein